MGQNHLSQRLSDTMGHKRTVSSISSATVSFCSASLLQHCSVELFAFVLHGLLHNTVPISESVSEDNVSVLSVSRVSFTVVSSKMNSVFGLFRFTSVCSAFNDSVWKINGGFLFFCFFDRGLTSRLLTDW